MGVVWLCKSFSVEAQNNFRSAGTGMPAKRPLY